MFGREAIYIIFVIFDLIRPDCSSRSATHKLMTLPLCFLVISFHVFLTSNSTFIIERECTDKETAGNLLYERRHLAAEAS